MTKLKVLDLFSGIGGFTRGLEETGGFETVAFCEIEEFQRRILKKHWPKVPFYNDVCQLTANQLRAAGISVDVICGGFPCQDISPAGRRAGIAGSRSVLGMEYVRLIGELRPLYAVMENSSELLDNGFDELLGALAQVGFDARWDCIPAAVFGAPHGRDRVWIVAYPSEIERVHEPDVGKELWRWVSDDRNSWPASPWSAPEAGICRVDDGIPNRVDRTGALGNAVVPIIPQIIGRAILEAEALAA